MSELANHLSYTFDLLGEIGCKICKDTYNIRAPGGADVCNLCAGENLAVLGKATQSSLHTTGIAYNAIDGNRATTWDQASCIHTNKEFNPWWRLDLGKTHKVFSVKITSYKESYRRLDGAEIRIGNSLDKNGNNNPR